MTDYATHEQALDRDCLTLSRHVLQQLQSFDADAQDLSALMNRIALAGKLIARRLSRAGLMEGVLGFTGAVNIQGEDVKKWMSMPTKSLLPPSSRVARVSPCL